MDQLLTFLHDQAQDNLLLFSSQKEAAQRFSRSLAEIEEISLINGILPARYQRNQNTITSSQQLTLFQSTVAVIGCGGLGGYIVEELARSGVGSLVIVDPDTFAEHNLNRQLYCTFDQLGEKKVVAAERRVQKINPAVRLRKVAETFDANNGPPLLKGVDVTADALDSIPARLTLCKVCRELHIPLVHGAIAGWYGNVATQYPGDNVIERIYATNAEQKGIETNLGNPSFTPAIVASLQVAEIIKVILQTGETLKQKYLSIDLLHLEVHEINFTNDST